MRYAQLKTLLLQTLKARITDEVQFRLSHTRIR
jgi:hypothetical protein